MKQEQKDKKAHQLTLEEYNKVKEKRAKNKLQVHFPLMVKFILFFPLVYLLFLIIYYLLHIRFATEH